MLIASGGKRCGIWAWSISCRPRGSEGISSRGCREYASVRGGNMPFAPKLSSPPTSEELKAFYEWLNRPQEMKSAPPPLPNGNGPVNSCPPVSPEGTEFAWPPLPVGVDSVEKLLELADREDPLARLEESAPLPAPADQATEPLQADDPAAKVIDEPKQVAVGQERSSWLAWPVLATLFLLFSFLLIPALLLVHKALVSHREDLPETLASNDRASEVGGVESRKVEPQPHQPPEADRESSAILPGISLQQCLLRRQIKVAR